MKLERHINFIKNRYWSFELFTKNQKTLKMKGVLPAHGEIEKYDKIELSWL